MARHPVISRWRATDPTGRVWFVYARSESEVLQRLGDSEFGVRFPLRIEKRALEDEEVVVRGRDG